MRGFRGFPEAKAEIEWFGFTYSAIMPGGSFFSALFLLSLPTFINLWAANVIISLLFFLFRRSAGVLLPVCLFALHLLVHWLIIVSVLLRFLFLSIGVNLPCFSTGQTGQR